MVHWVYVLECEDRYIYIGETTRLYRRFSEHQRGGGAVNTHEHKPEKLIALYKVSENASFLDYRNSILRNIYDKGIIRLWGDDDSANLEVENHFTEIYMYQRNKIDDEDFMYDDGNWQKVKGGKYTKEIWANPTLKMNKQLIIDRPNCHCLIPSEVKISRDKKTIYFVCALKNKWEDFYQDLETDEPCDFYKVYSDDAIVKTKYEVAHKKISEEWCSRIPVTKNSIYPESCILCKSINYIPHYSWYQNRRVCEDCILNKYDELKKQYSFTDNCLIQD